jgi:hypothetical protein
VGWSMEEFMDRDKANESTTSGLLKLECSSALFFLIGVMMMMRVMMMTIDLARHNSNKNLLLDVSLLLD